MQKGMNKRGQDLSIGTLILIVLGIVVLVLLILGFSMGWENLWNKINIFGGGSSSVADVTTACRLAFTSQDKSTLCDKTWKIKENANERLIGCRDLTVVSSLGKSESEFGCPTNNKYSETIARCKLSESECKSLSNDDCNKAPNNELCEWKIKVEKTDSTPEIPAHCAIKEELAKNTCLPIVDKKACEDKIGCAYS